MELVTEEAVLGIIDDWWRRSPASPLKAAQITLRLGPRLRRPVDVPLLVPHVVGVIRDLARRGYVRALPDGSAILSYLPALARTGGRDPWTDPAVAPGSTGSPVAAPATPTVVVSTAIAPTWGTVEPFVPAPVEPWRARPQRSGGGTAALGIRQADRLILRCALIFFLVVTIAVVATLDRLIDIPIRTHGVLYCGNSGRPSSGLPRCAGGR